MDVPFAPNFNDYVALMAKNSPHALVMDWWRRLDLTLHEYAAALGQVVRGRDRRPIEEAVPLNDAALTSCIRAVRQRRRSLRPRSIQLDWDLGKTNLESGNAQPVSSCWRSRIVRPALAEQVCLRSAAPAEPIRDVQS